MKMIKYRIELLEPALVASAQGDPNSAVAFDYLPGSVLRGILIGKYLGSRPADASDATLRRLFFDGTTRYLNGYLQDTYGNLYLPVPLSWQRVKDDTKGKISDFAVKTQHDEQQWQPVKEPFYTQTGEGVTLIRPEHNLAVHTQRTPPFGRAMSGESIKLLGKDDIPGAIYRYDALAAGQVFQAAIICDHDADEQTLRDLLSGYITLGGSRSGGYGRAEIKINDNDSSREADEDDEDGPADKLIVTLRSDALVRDERGQFAVDPELLCRVLGKRLKVELQLKNAFLGAQVVAGFNRKWRLPLPQALAARMGSVLVFQDPGCDPSLLHDLEIRGIGERRAEGFGCIAFNQQSAEELQVSKITLKSRGLAVSINETEAEKLARLMVKRMLRKRIDEGMLAKANGVTIANPPSNAQISRLRGIILEQIREATLDIGKLRLFIKGVRERSSSRRQFERSTVNNVPLLSWLDRLLTCDGKDVWNMADNDWRAELGLEEMNLDAQIGGVKAVIDDDMRLQYMLRFIDLVLAHVAKVRGKEG